LIDQETGYIVRPFDRRALGEKISLLIDDAEKRRAMGSRGREFALGRFDAKVMVEALERVYREARELGLAG
jgi:glycosyltransferase involved in cell wall biosynthesis